jgi:VWFA-related protein
MDSKDSVALYSLGRTLRVLCDFTNDRNELLTALGKYQARELTSREVVEPGSIHTAAPGDFNATVDRERRALAGLVNASRTAATMTALQQIAGRVASVPGRKSLVWLTADLPFSGREIGRVLSRADIAVYPVDARGLMTRQRPLMQGDDAEPPGLATMREMAEESGGTAFINTNDVAGAVERAVNDTASSFTLGFYPEADWFDDKPHALKVQVKRQGFEVRYPKVYFAAKELNAPADNAFENALQSPLETAAIPLLVRVERSGTELRVSGVVDIHKLVLRQAGSGRSGSLEVYLFEQDLDGHPLSRERQVLTLHLTDELYRRYAKAGVRFQQSIAYQEGLAKLRVLVNCPQDGSLGSVIIAAPAIQ